MRVEVVMAWPHRFESVWLELPEGARLADALAAVDLEEKNQASGCAIFGLLARPDAPLHEGDRIELLRPLLADPKEARRRRAQLPR